MKSYSYPISLDWSKQEVIDVIHFFQCIEEAYEKGVPRDKLLNAYNRFKHIVPSKGDEKRICKEFEKATECSCYLTMKQAKTMPEGQKIHM